MIDVFTEEIEVIIKDGLANLYWYRNDLKKAFIKAGVDERLCHSLISSTKADGTKFTKREMMDALYERLRKIPYAKRLEISRNFVRILVEHQNFVPQDPKHRITIAETNALKLKQIIYEQNKQDRAKQEFRRQIGVSRANNYNVLLSDIHEKFIEISKYGNQKRGYALEALFNQLMKISNIPVEKPFRIEGEQIDGAIKYDGHYYIVEVKWIERQVSQADIASLYMKVEGKLEARGLFIAMNGYSPQILSSLPRGKEIKVLLLDGIHFSNVISGIYSFNDLMEYAIKEASLRANIYCSHLID